jgi:hypothetical protein
MASTPPVGGSNLNSQYPNYAAAWTSIVNYDANGYPLYRLPVVMPPQLRCAAIIPTGSTNVPPAI